MPLLPISSPGTVEPDETVTETGVLITIKIGFQEDALTPPLGYENRESQRPLKACDSVTEVLGYEMFESSLGKPETEVISHIDPHYAPHGYSMKSLITNQSTASGSSGPGYMTKTNIEKLESTTGSIIESNTEWDMGTEVDLKTSKIALGKRSILMKK